MMWWSEAMFVSGAATFIAGVSFQSNTFQLRCRGAPRGESRCFGENYCWAAQCYYWLQSVGLNLFIMGRSWLLCANQSFDAAPFRGELMLFQRRFLDARRGLAERIRLVHA